MGWDKAILPTWKQRTESAARDRTRVLSGFFFFLLWLNYFFEVAKNGFYSFSSRQILKRIKNFFKNRQISLWGFTIVAKKMWRMLKRFLLSYIFFVAKIWLNCRKDDRHFSYMRKMPKKKKKIPDARRRRRQKRVAREGGKRVRWIGSAIA
jgi:hypothetical protein